MIRVVLPVHLRTLAAVTGEVAIEVAGEATLGAVLDALTQIDPARFDRFATALKMVSITLVVIGVFGLHSSSRGVA